MSHICCCRGTQAAMLCGVMEGVYGSSVSQSRDASVRSSSSSSDTGWTCPSYSCLSPFQWVWGKTSPLLCARPQSLAREVHQSILLVISLFSVLQYIVQIIYNIQEGSEICKSDSKFFSNICTCITYPWKAVVTYVVNSVFKKSNLHGRVFLV